jgi:hypothetical protein
MQYIAHAKQIDPTHLFTVNLNPTIVNHKQEWTHAWSLGRSDYPTIGTYTVLPWAEQAGLVITVCSTN